MKRILRSFLRNDDATAAIEAGFLMPVLLIILCGMIDMGAAVVTNLKVTNSAQMVSDLVSRGVTVTTGEINDAVVAGRMALAPYDTTAYGVDIVGIQFVGTNRVPTQRWRDTRNMTANDDVLANSAGLGLQDEGVIAVTVTFTYEPYFSGFLVDTLTMSEEAYVRGRKGGFVNRV
jgi:Flp pilus assembly protein TadG